MTARVSTLLKSHASLTCFRACFLPGRDKDLSAPRYSQLYDKIVLNKINSSGLYKLKCKTCNNSYVGQTRKSIKIRHREHQRYIKTSNPISAYALLILNNKIEQGTAYQTIQLLNHTTKGTKTKCWGIIFHTDFPTTKHTNRRTESQRP